MAKSSCFVSAVKSLSFGFMTVNLYLSENAQAALLCDRNDAVVMLNDKALGKQFMY
jgi:hypothetical protein